MKRFLNLRALLVVMMALATIITLLGGIGSICVAFNAEQYGPIFAKLAPYKPVLQALVYVSLLAAVAMMVVTYWTARGSKWFFVGAIATLTLGAVAAAVQMYYSSSVRGIPFFSAAPTNIRLYLTLAALFVFVLIRFTPGWRRVNQRNSKPGSPITAVGVSLAVVALVTLSTPLWAGDSHTVDGSNLVLVLETPLLVGGIAMLMVGLGMVACELARTRVKLARSLAARTASKLIALSALVWVSSACEPLPPPPPPGGWISSPTPTGVSSVSSKPQSAANSFDSPRSSEEPLQNFVEDCMAGCHFPEANESFAAGAMPQPTNHKGRTICLECHAALAQPRLPATHSGRMDPACALCHLPPEAAAK